MNNPYDLTQTKTFVNSLDEIDTVVNEWIINQLILNNTFRIIQITPFITNSGYQARLIIYKTSITQVNESLIITSSDLDEILDNSIKELDLSIRTYNCLARANIKTIRDILKFNDINDLLNIRNFGQKSLKEIINKLKKYGIDID